jgi:hypothetical protein
MAKFNSHTRFPCIWVPSETSPQWSLRKLDMYVENYVLPKSAHIQHAYTATGSTRKRDPTRNQLRDLSHQKTYLLFTTNLVWAYTQDPPHYNALQSGPKGCGRSRRSVCGAFASRGTYLLLRSRVDKADDALRRAISTLRLFISVVELPRGDVHPDCFYSMVELPRGDVHP